jgi:hypothetical protein
MITRPALSPRQRPPPTPVPWAPRALPPKLLRLQTARAGLRFPLPCCLLPPSLSVPRAAAVPHLAYAPSFCAVGARRQPPHNGPPPYRVLWPAPAAARDPPAASAAGAAVPAPQGPGEARPRDAALSGALARACGRPMASYTPPPYLSRRNPAGQTAGQTPRAVNTLAGERACSPPRLHSHRTGVRTVRTPPCARGGRSSLCWRLAPPLLLPVQSPETPLSGKALWPICPGGPHPPWL